MVSDLLVRRLLIFRFAVLLIAAFLPFGNPHVERQLDTMGIAARYWSRWTLEPEARFPLVPAVLGSGDTDGFLVRELPLVSFVTAPGFALGKRAGRTAAMLLLLALLAAGWWAIARIWRGVCVAGVDAGRAMLLLPLLSLSAVYAGKFLPDVLALLLALAGTGLLFRGVKPWIAAFLVLLGLLVQPAVIVVLGLLLSKGNRHVLTGKYLLPLETVLLAALAYQTSGALLGSIPTSLFELFAKRLFFLGGGILVAGIYLARRHAIAGRALWQLLALQWLVVAAFSGYPSFMRDYLFLGLAPTVCLLFVAACEAGRHRVVQGLLAAGLVLTAVDLSWNDVNVFGTSHKARLHRLYRQCDLLVSRNPDFPWGEGKVFRSGREADAEMALCFVERSGSSTAAYGFYRVDAAVDAGCEVIDLMSELKLARCRR